MSTQITIDEFQQERAAGAYDYTCPQCGCVTDLVASNGEHYHWDNCSMLDTESDDAYRNEQSNSY